MNVPNFLHESLKKMSRESKSGRYSLSHHCLVTLFFKHALETKHPTINFGDFSRENHINDLLGKGKKKRRGSTISSMSPPEPLALAFIQLETHTPTETPTPSKSSIPK